MTLRHLRIFIKVYQFSSITKAAQALDIAQPSISLAIKELENQYTILLFDRIGKRIYPTNAAKKFYDYAIHILSLYDQMENEISNFHETALHIGCVISIGQYLLIPLIKEFQKKLPNIKLYTIINNQETIEKMVLNNIIDFALIAGNTDCDTSLVKETFFHHSMCFVAHPSHPLVNKSKLSLKDLSNYDFLVREKGSATRRFIDSLFLSNNLHITPVMESASTSTLVEAVKANLGISCVPYLYVKNEIEKADIVALTIPNINLKTPFSIIYHHHKYLTPAAQLFIELCKEYANQKS